MFRDMRAVRHFDGIPLEADVSLVVLHTERSTGWGGQEMRTISEAVGVAERGHRVVIVASPGAQILGRAAAAGLPTYSLRMRNAFDVIAIAKLVTLIRREKADIVNTHSSIDSWVGAFAAKLSGVKLVRTRHLSAPISRNPLNFVHRLPDAIITTGETARQRLLVHNRLRPSILESIPTGVDCEMFRPRPRAPEARRALGLPPGATILTKVAVLRRLKRHDVLLEAASLLKDRHGLYFVLVGEGSQREPIEESIRSFGLQDRFKLFGHLDDIRPVLACTDILVSSSDTEGVPQSAAQAMAMEVPVVHTKVGSVGELIEDGVTGLLVPPADPAALAAAIRKVLDFPDWARECARRGREHVVENHSRERMIERVLGVYKRLLAGP
jgi:glycosyltransferase involved in cell wall biosynthesis